MRFVDSALSARCAVLCFTSMDFIVASALKGRAVWSGACAGGVAPQAATAAGDFGHSAQAVRAPAELLQIEALRSTEAPPRVLLWNLELSVAVSSARVATAWLCPHPSGRYGCAHTASQEGRRSGSRCVPRHPPLRAPTASHLHPLTARSSCTAHSPSPCYTRTLSGAHRKQWPAATNHTRCHCCHCCHRCVSTGLSHPSNS